MAAAAALVARFDLGLRAGDALHLAIAHATPTLTMVTFDRRLREASIATGLNAMEPN
jgi:predicted nucleic acid-binding protein